MIQEAIRKHRSFDYMSDYIYQASTRGLCITTSCLRFLLTTYRLGKRLFSTRVQNCDKLGIQCKYRKLAVCGMRTLISGCVMGELPSMSKLQVILGFLVMWWLR